MAVGIVTTPKDLPLASLKQELIDSLPENKEWTNSDTCVTGNLMFLTIEEKGIITGSFEVSLTFSSGTVVTTTYPADPATQDGSHTNLDDIDGYEYTSGATYVVSSTLLSATVSGPTFTGTLTYEQDYGLHYYNVDSHTTYVVSVQIHTTATFVAGVPSSGHSQTTENQSIVPYGTYNLSSQWTSKKAYIS